MIICWIKCYVESPGKKYFEKDKSVKKYDLMIARQPTTIGSCEDTFVLRTKLYLTCCLKIVLFFVLKQ